MEIVEYNVVYDENFHPQLKKLRTYEWENQDDERLLYLEDAPWLFQQTFEMSTLAEEYMYVLSLDVTWRVKGVYQLAHGNSQEFYIRMRELFIFLFLTGADCFIVAHNHPDGGIEKSDDDSNLTDKIKSSADMLGFEFLEHFIVSKDGYSMILNDVEMNYSKLAIEMH